jgi:hypothetical protein
MKALPNKVLDDRNAFLGTSGSGKTYGAGTAVERLLDAKARVVIVDPLDVWWGLRLSADGKSAAYPIVIFGGAHGDLPINEHAGALIGETVAGMAESCIVSLGGFPTKSAERRFMLAFLETLYRKASGEPFHIVFDEADLWAPQKASEPMLQNLMEQIVRRGRVKGFIPWLISQRPAVLSKDVLSQADTMIAMKLTSSQDRDAIGAWIEGQADKAEEKRILASLPTMQRGQGIVWAPAHGILDDITFPEKKTFDSSRTPKRGEKKQATATLAALNLDKLREKLSTVEAETKANDPKALKAEIATLKRNMASASAIVRDPKEIEQAERSGYERGASAANHILDDAVAGLRALAERIEALRKTVTYKAAAPVAQRIERPLPKREVAGSIPAGRANGNGHLQPAKQRILDAIAWFNAIGIEQPERSPVAFLADTTSASSAYANNLSALKTAGLIDYPISGKLSLTEEGKVIARQPERSPTGEELRGAIAAKLTPALNRIVTALVEQYPDPLSREETAQRAATTPDSSAFANNVSRLRTLGIIEYPAKGALRASDLLFP